MAGFPQVATRSTGQVDWVRLMRPDWGGEDAYSTGTESKQG